VREYNATSLEKGEMGYIIRQLHFCSIACFESAAWTSARRALQSDAVDRFQIVIF